jgi:VWFA-related protein
MNRRDLLWIAALCVAGAVIVWQGSGSTLSAQGQQRAAPTQPVSATDAKLPSEAGVFKAQAKLVLVDSVVTDKKGNYIRDLRKEDFRVWEDNKEQTVKTFSYEAGNASPNNPTKRYLVLFFDNSTLGFSDQATVRQAATKFIDANAGENRLIALVDFGGTLRITQNFTADADRLKQVVAGIKFSTVSSNARAPEVASLGTPGLMNLEANFGARTMLMAVRDLAKRMAEVPGRKSLVLLTAGFPLTSDVRFELNSVVDACNRANVAVYPIDVRGLINLGVTPASGANIRTPLPFQRGHLVTATFIYAGSVEPATHLLLVQHRNPPPPPPSTHNAPSPPPPPRVQPPLVGKFPPSVTTNQQVLYLLADGTGGFVIHDTNDLLGGMDRIAKEQSEYYLIGYIPPDSPEDSCHVLRVKVVRDGTTVRSRSGYCNAKPVDLLAGKPIERELENRAVSSQAGNVSGSLEAPFFFTSPKVARVNLAMEASSNSIKFIKERGKFHSDVNVLGIATKSDGSEAARFSDTVHLEFENKGLEEFLKRSFQYENQFDIAPGEYRLTVVFSSGGENFGKLEAPLAVDGYDGNYLGLSGLALSKELHPVSEVSEKLDADLMEGHAPLVFHGTEVVPAADYHFSRTEPFTVYLEIYDPLLTAPNPPKVGLLLKIVDTKTGKAKIDVNITNTEGSVQPGNPRVPMAVKVPVNELDPGSYRLELRAMDSTGNRTRARTADFVVD